MCLHSTPITHPLQAHCLHESMPDSFSDFGLGNHLMTASKQGLRWPYMEDKSPKTPINHSKRKGDTHTHKKKKPRGRVHHCTFYNFYSTFTKKPRFTFSLPSPSCILHSHTGTHSFLHHIFFCT